MPTSLKPAASVSNNGLIDIHKPSVWVAGNKHTHVLFRTSDDNYYELFSRLGNEDPGKDPNDDDAIVNWVMSVSEKYIHDPDVAQLYPAEAEVRKRGSGVVYTVLETATPAQKKEDPETSAGYVVL